MPADALGQAQTVLTLVKTDLAAAQGKMNLSSAEIWVNEASSILSTAAGNQSQGKTALAGPEAGGALELLNAADDLMVAQLGTALPSQQNRPQPPAPPRGTNSPSSRAQVSRELVHTYQEIIAQRDALNQTTLGSPWTTILSQAEGLYKDADTSYLAGEYDQAQTDAHVAGHLMHAIAHVAPSAVAPDQPVPVPAPNF